MVAETTTFPIDITKTRLQLHGESLSSARPTSAIRVAAEIVRGREGPLGLYKGLSPAIIRHLFYTPIRIVCYEHLRNTFLVPVPTDQSLSFSSKALIGGISGVIAQVFYLLVSILCFLLVRIAIFLHILKQLHQCLESTTYYKHWWSILVKLSLLLHCRLKVVVFTRKFWVFRERDAIVFHVTFCGIWSELEDQSIGIFQYLVQSWELRATLCELGNNKPIFKKECTVTAVISVIFSPVQLSETSFIGLAIDDFLFSFRQCD